jgi:hypothetical protein
VSFVGQALLVLVIAGGVLALGAVAAYFLVRRVVRRRWREVRGHAVTRGVVAGASTFTAWRARAGLRAPSGELRHATPPHARRLMWRAIQDAEAAVQHADARHAPVAELPAVCRSLRHVGAELDQMLRLERRLPTGQGGPDAVRTQVSDVIRAAQDVQSAALRACSDATEPQIQSLVRTARDEIEIVGAALSRMRSIASH